MEGIEIRSMIEEKFPDAVISQHGFRGDDTMVVDRKVLHELLEFVRREPALDFNLLVDICGADYVDMDRTPRFEVVYHLSSIRHHQRLRLRFPVPEEDLVVPTVTDIWCGANWFERETYDMYGIRFLNHPNLKRILTHESFGAHPLRKDYPMNRRPKLHPAVADILTRQPYKG